MAYALRDFGSYTVGGRLHRVTEGAVQTLPVTREVTLEYDPRGLYAVEHGYVQYFVPEARNDRPPVLLLHGGGMSGAVWETTPDGRPGWLHGLLARGYEVHVLDNVERGRAGFAPGLWEGAPILRSLEDAWTLFRIGPAAGFDSRTPFSGQRFPVCAMEAFARSFVPRWLSTTPRQIAVVTALLDRLGPAIVVCHSQGAEAAFGALEQGARAEGLIAIEPSCGLSRPVPLSRAVLLVGDYLDSDAFWASRRTAWQRLGEDFGAALSWIESGDVLARGHSHQPMMDHGNMACLDTCLAALDEPET